MFDFTRATLHQALAAVAFLAIAAGPLGAQSYRTALGVTGGWSVPADLTPGLESATALEPGWTLGLQHERWWGSRRVATRINAGYAERWIEGFGSRYQLFSADAALLVRLLPSARDRFAAPFIGLGAGAIMYAGMHGSVPLAGGIYGNDPVERAFAVASLGADLFTGSPLGLRIEAVDQIVLPSLGYSPPSTGLPRAHNLEVRTAVQLRTGRVAAPAVVATAVRPAPAPAPAPAPHAAAASDAARLQARIDEQAREITRLSNRLDALEQARPAGDRAPLGTPVSVAPSHASAPRQLAAPAVDGPFFTVHFSSFIEPETARVWADRLTYRDLPVWVTDHRVRGQRVNRLRVGAMPTRADADRLARTLERDYGWDVQVERVDGGESG